MITMKEAKELREAILAAAENMDDETAAKHPSLFRKMNFDGSVIKAGTRVNFNGEVKRVTKDITDDIDNTPEKIGSIWKNIST